MGVVQTSGEKKKIIINLLLESDMVRKLINQTTIRYSDFT